ncbi:MAG: polysaccharide pyruvyl transferase family protein [Clostridia bacterium]|nr:polysaccharide pyruvyl transferase family protein [Clostridia bacterium]
MLGVCLKYTQNNYGSKLQALATVKMFQQLGLEYEIIRYNKKTLGFYAKSLPRFFNIVFLNDRYEQFQQKLAMKQHPEIGGKMAIRNKAFDSFDVYFNDTLSPVYKNYSYLKKNCGNLYDKVITCSDQLWSPSALGSGFYNLMFVPEHTPKVSWASSFGVGAIPWYQKGRTKRYLNRIEHISMRENRGAQIVKELTGKEVPVLMDPVFVFNKQEWETLVPVQEPEWDDYIFCYFLGPNPEHRKAAMELSRKTGKKIVTMRHLDRYVKEDEAFGDVVPYDVDPVRFLNILRNASYVCTDSFHGTAFCILNEKKFMVFNRYSDASANSKNSRIDSVCQLLGLSDRRFTNVETVARDIEKEIDYKSVAERIEQYRNNTKEYLKSSLGVEE